MKCAKKDGEEDECWSNVINKRYKFYLSFENSICTDYVTEKFWNPMNMSSIVPVVLGGANYTAIAPTHSYIDAQTFGTPQKLAEYLHYLNGNSTEYMRYLLWKTKFRVSASQNLALCQVCEKLNDPSSSTKQQIRTDLKAWWRDDGNCLPSGHFPWSHQHAAQQHSIYSASYWLGNAKNAFNNIVSDLRQSKVVV